MSLAAYLAVASKRSAGAIVARAEGWFPALGELGSVVRRLM